MSDRDPTRAEPPHDVLAADEYGMPAADPELHARAEPPHDVLAADEYGMPAPDPDLHHHQVALPPDPTGIEEPHDILAAEEFPMPAPRRSGAAAALARRPGGTGRLMAEVLALVIGVLLLRRGRRR